MSELEEKYELFYRTCTRMFSKAMDRILRDPDLPYTKKLDHLHKIDEYINKAVEKRL